MYDLLVWTSEEEWAELQNFRSFISLVMRWLLLRILELYGYSIKKDNSGDKKYEDTNEIAGLSHQSYC